MSMVTSYYGTDDFLGEKGFEKGIEKVAKQMLLKGFSIQDICELTGLTSAEIEKLKTISIN
ncbi:hypothetical protein [Alkalihalobacillus sp. BA299]|uniref:hypothetical protein n=1 Tax=Alkalihalobacillus sp. BA299 TaxID=2815938 RepID=UPI001ADD0853|nr:hypothetical protein [Alkalihalobacillus sp. BA299]